MIIFVITLKHPTHDISLHQNGRLSFPLWLCLSEYGNIINIFKLYSYNHVVKFDFQLEGNIYICIYVRGNQSHEIWSPSHCSNFNSKINQIVIIRITQDWCNNKKSLNIPWQHSCLLSCKILSWWGGPVVREKYINWNCDLQFFSETYIL